MTVSTKPSKPSVPWFWIGIAMVFLMSVYLRFWGLGRFNTLVFDEVYFAKYGNNYLTHTPFFDVHPPLGKYLIAIGIWIGTHLPVGHDSLNRLTGSQLSTFSYRWLNAFTGSLIPLVVGAIAYQLSQRRSYALIAALFVAADGLFLVESRYALLSIYPIIFGLLGQLFFLIALDQPSRQRRVWMALSGIGFGASISVKWYGLGFLIGTFLVWLLAQGVNFLQSTQPTLTEVGEVETPSYSSPTCDFPTSSPENRADTRTLLQKLVPLKSVHLLFYWGFIPIVFYCLVWIPHLLLNPKLGLWELHQQMLTYHKQLGSGPQEHPYCSAWYTWPWMIRPMGYYFQKVETPSSGSSLHFFAPPSPKKMIYYDVHGMGNPVLWWLGAIAILLLLVLLVLRIRAWRTVPGVQVNQSQTPLGAAIEFWIVLYLVVNYAANFLPWMIVTRCSFLYYYMSASVFAFLGLAWLVEQSLRGYDLFLRIVGVTMIFLILVAFVFWLPVFLGLPLSPEEFQSRMWLPSWI